MADIYRPIGSDAFMARLERGDVILCDGAMGTELYSRGGAPFDRAFDELNLTHPDLVKSVHLDYIGAGVEIIATNTFGANRIRLAKQGQQDLMEAINRQGVAIACEARRLTGQALWIAGSMGPLGKLVGPLGSVSLKEVRECFREQAQILIDEGVDLLIFETFGSLKEIQEAILAVRNITTLPIIAQMTFSEDRKTLDGDQPSEVVNALEALSVAVIGANCGVGSDSMLSVVEEMLRVSHLPVIAQANAGFPAYVNGRFIYLASPDYVAQSARQMNELGVRLLGGCCGTTPGHIAAMRNILHHVPSGISRPTNSTSMTPSYAEPSARPRLLASEPTEFAQKMGRKFVVTVEVDPPRGFDVSKSLQGLAKLQTSGLIDAANVPDNPRAQGHMSALAMSTLIQTKLGMETICHLATRHRNIVALHSELLGAHALGIRNIFAIMGDLPRLGDYPDATAVSDVTASGLIQLIKAFNQGNGLNTKPIEQPTSFFVGCAFNMGSDNPDRELRILERKLKAGVDFMITQPVFNSELVEQWWQRLGGFPVPLLLGVLPLWSHRHAEFLHNEIPGISIPDDIRSNLSRSTTRGPEQGIELAQNLLTQTHHRIAGVYFIPPFGRYDVVEQILRGVDGISSFPDSSR